jgi:hypothetical protein
MTRIPMMTADDASVGTFGTEGHLRFRDDVARDPRNREPGQYPSHYCGPRGFIGNVVESGGIK